MNDIFVSLMLLGAISTSDGYLPYWMTTNQYGLMPERNGSLALLSAHSQYDGTKTWQYKWGASVGANYFNNPLDPDGSSTNIMLDQLYVSIKWKMLTIDLGQKHRENDFLGASESLGSLSVTGGHLVESGNARSMPGYLGSFAPVAVPFTKKHLLIYGAFGDYSTTDQRYCQGALVHRTRVGFKIVPSDKLCFDAVLDHYAIWGGTSPQYGKMAVNIDNYLRMVTGCHAGPSGTISDRVNVIGDQGGSEIFRASYQGDGWSIVAQHDIPYNDGSGMGFQNFPDGVNSVYIKLDNSDKWVSSFLYEHQYTMYQSGSMKGESYDDFGNITTPSGVKTTGGDSYFRNWQYKSCWTHYGHVIGDPLILPGGVRAKKWSSSVINLTIENNRLKSHHIGIGGCLFHKHPYKFLLTYSDNYGNYGDPYVGDSVWQKPWGSVKEYGLKQLSFSLSGLINDFLHHNVCILYGLFADYGELYEHSVGAVIGVRYNID